MADPSNDGAGTSSQSIMSKVCKTCGISNDAEGGALLRCAFVIYMIQKGPQVEIQIAACVLGDKKGGDALFAELPVSRALGFPLGIAKQPVMGLQVPNIGAQILSIDPDPKSLTFGQCLPAYLGTGGLIVARCDGKPLHGLHVEALLHYVQHVVWPKLDAMEQREKAGEVVDRQEVKDQLLTPAAFATGFGTYKEMQMARVDDSEREELRGVECPV
ncbi:hypothetical protein LTR56_013107 [Elasticomyces elasticus]|nr:hypothetical protein LTR56_013107 [Elasticomyces elasticus]KAK3640286.1 hypothetical protein LTR22_017121 [Elasticomyces elasticus]KAK4920563.1 hypothetical protein LTR49_011978 [Elasticomyces elasticus]KAK5758937.1 hypothetical protein LTS12_010878 [Elasticomyces elasticus]